MAKSAASIYESLWEQRTPDLAAFLAEHGLSSGDELLFVLLVDVRHRWQTDAPMSTVDYLQMLPQLQAESRVVLQLVVAEYEARCTAGEQVDVEQLVRQHDALGDDLVGQARRMIANSAEMMSSDVLRSTTDVDAERSQTMIGRFRVDRLLGEGAFGRVWLGYDPQLKRQVAIKVPKPGRLSSREAIESYLGEARALATLEHPHIVPVFDVGSAERYPVYVVSRYVDGKSLAKSMDELVGDFPRIALLISDIAEALSHAHDRRLIHRDVKPENILIDARRHVYITDFGLAIREEDYLSDGRIAGTPPYMSPEQARGEGHRLDGRSDLFSLGAVFYELLTKQQPFTGSSSDEILKGVIANEPVPPRQINRRIPNELERICLKMLAKRPSDRFATGAELTVELKTWVAVQTTSESIKIERPPFRGLRSFDANDASGFIQLLPGALNADRMPDSIQFWKSRIESREADAISVGLVYGPSGSGKSSLIKAGLLPRLAPAVTSVYVEATPVGFESAILKAIRRADTGLATTDNLTETFRQIRRQHDGKVLVVLDQFEQWLQVRGDFSESELVDALRQCDGSTLQVLLLVRDDFGMAVARFMQALEIRILEGENFTTVDLFTTEHAERVLAYFGQALNRLPLHGEPSDEERRFIKTAVEELVEYGRVVPVRLAVLAQMIKDRPWEMSTLKAVGGTRGIGVRFLNDTFVSRSANPQHRLLEPSARRVLASLLPTIGSDIKGHRMPLAELERVASQANGSFDELRPVLDDELRLITPVDSPSDGSEASSYLQSHDSTKRVRYYQLTHDYLVPALREWISEQQRHSRQGRAELRLQERVGIWESRPEDRHLPSLYEYLSIRLFTNRNLWSPAETAMMMRTGRIMLTTTLIVVLLLTLVFGGLRIRLRGRVSDVVARMTAGEQLSPDSVKRLYDLRKTARAPLQKFLESEPPADDKVTQWRRNRGLAAGMLFAAGEQDSVLAMLGEVESDELITHFVQQSFVAISPKLTDLLDETDRLLELPEPNVNDADAVRARDRVLYAMLMLLGEYSLDQIPPSTRTAQSDRWKEKLSKLYQTHPSSAVHSISGWLLHRWFDSKYELEKRLARGKMVPTLDALAIDGSGRRFEWFVHRFDSQSSNDSGAPAANSPPVNGQYVTFIVFPSGTYDLGSRTPVAGEPSTQVEIDWPFAIADRELTRRELEMCGFGTEGMRVGDRDIFPTLDHPGGWIDWRGAIEACDKLTELAVDPTLVTAYDHATPEMPVNNNQRGFRLPAEAEWEVACRGGSRGLYCFGDDIAMLSRYGWYNANVAEWPGPLPRQLRPNMRGLFDVHGSVAEWCFDRARISDDKPQANHVQAPWGLQDGNMRVVRGGAIASGEDLCRSGYRNREPPEKRSVIRGIRPAIRMEE